MSYYYNKLWIDYDDHDNLLLPIIPWAPHIKPVY